MKQQRGVTLIEGLFFSSLALVLVVLTIAFYTQSWRLFDTRTRTTALATDARKLFEQLVTGVRAAVVVTRPLSVADWRRDKTLVFYRHAGGDARQRLAVNQAGGAGREYPYSSDSSDETVQSYDCFEETFRLSGAVLEWSQAGGYLKRTSVRGGETRYTFDPDSKVGPASKQTMAQHVAAFEVVPIGYLAAPGPKGPMLAAARSDGTPLSPEEIALLAFRFRAEDRPADRPKDADAGVFELVTKVWLDERSMALRFPGAFSSIDNQLEY